MRSAIDPAVADTHPSDPQAPIDPLIAATAASDPQMPEAARLRVVGAGDTLGRYELGEEIGEGGMATVFRARDRELRRDVAIKVLFPHLAKRPEVVQRFHREARAAAGLDHPNILRVFDVGGGTGADPSAPRDPPYIVMELIRGRSLLAEIEQRGPALAEIVASVGALLADALAAAHAASIVHRDVKPANVMVAHGGRLLLADFGVARLETEDSLVTKTGAVLGTPAYMAPEQAAGDTATAKSDLYSLGATLYQLATGSLPYTGSPAKVLASIAAGTVTPAVRRRPAVGAELSRAIERMMATDPAARPASAAALAAELRGLAKVGGLGEPREELAVYFGDVETWVKDRTGSVVDALVTGARRAIEEGKLPRAMALADRASAMAPEDVAVAELVKTVTEGGQAGKRRRVAAIAVAVVVLAGGVAAAGVGMLGGGDGDRDGDRDRGGDRDASTSPLPTTLPSPSTTTATSTPPSTTPDAAVVEIDAGVVAVAAPRDAARRHDAALDASVDATAPIDAEVMAVVIDAAPRPGAIRVINDLWCYVTIDGGQPTMLVKTPYPVPPGHHKVTCSQPSPPRSWTQDVDVADGQTVTAKGSMLAVVAVTVAVSGGATIDGVAYPEGAVAKVGGHLRVEIAGRTDYLDFRQNCTLRRVGNGDGTARFECDP
jgi:hypothetical protein|nr:serine/threonine-protein kinase [Kofleriaceae bacterium]